MNDSGPSLGPPGRPGGIVLWLWTALLLASGATGATLLTGSSLFAQSIVSGEVGGTVMDEASRPIRGAAAMLTEVRTGMEWTSRTRSDGLIDFRAVPGGTYELRVEALGYRPLVVVGLGVTPGERITVPVRLAAEAPPLTRVDTLHHGLAGGAAPGLGRRAGWRELSTVPDRLRDVGGLLALSSSADTWGGLDGLPASHTVLFADGEPFHPAAHPSLPGTGDPLGLLFPRIGLQSLTVRTRLEDIEWSGAPGGILALETRPPLGRASGELYGFWSGGPTWNNEVVGEGPDLLSAWGGGSASLPVGEDASPLSVSFEGALVETPNLFWRNDYYQSRLPEGEALPGTRTVGYGSGLARGAWKVGESARLTLRASGSAFRHESDRKGTHQAGYGSELPAEGSDGSVAAVVSFPVGERTRLEIRGSGGLSSRTWGGDEPSPAAWLARDRALLGSHGSFPASTDRLDFSVTPVAHFRTGENRIKAGVRLSYASFETSHLEHSSGAFFFGSRTGLLSGDGAAIVVDGDVPTQSFASTRATLFGQYRWTAFPGLDLTSGISYQLETLPLSDVRAANRWVELTGVIPGTIQGNLTALDGHVHLRWDLRNDGSTWLVGGLGLDHGFLDPGAMHEALTLDGEVEVKRFVGRGLDWSGGELPTDGTVTGTRLALLGPGLEGPRTARATMGLHHTLFDALRVGVTGTFRRTESILRRADLNRLHVASGTDQHGRPLFGEMEIVSGVLAADPETNRRFPAFERVWALNPDGWSEYRGATASVEAPVGEDGFVSVRYTWSETTDNWVGASRGGASSRLVADLDVEAWDEATSDFDVPHRLNALVVLPLPLPWDVSVSGLYTLRSAMPFTPRVASGLDANGDGSFFNDVAYVPAEGPVIEELAREWSCLTRDAGGFAVRNGCRADPVHTLNLRLTLGLPSVAGVSSALVVDGLNLTDTDMGIRDENLLLLGGGTVTKTDDGVEIPYKVNPGFGNWVYRGDTGRMLRIGLRVGKGGIR